MTVAVQPTVLRMGRSVLSWRGVPIFVRLTTPMLVRKLELENVKCFAHREIDFTLGGGADEPPQRWIVIYGNNGMGKSTLLRSIGLALVGQPALNSLLPNAAGWVRAGKKHATVRVLASKGAHDRSIGAPRTRPLDLRWRLIGPRPVRFGGALQPAHSIVLDPGDDPSTIADAKLFTEQVSLDEPGRGWMIAGYGPLRRLSGASSEVWANMSPDGRAARLATLFHEKAALSTAELWLRKLHHLQSTGNATGRKQYQAVTDIISSGLLPEGVELADVTPDDVLFKTPFGSHIPMPELSDGLRTVLAITLDLLRQVSLCFRLSDVVESRGPTKGHGIVTAEGTVLIDELDSHLHPTWQRRIASWLHSRFPNIQFIVATHSPLIATKVSEDHGMIVRLRTQTIGKGQFVVPEVEPGIMGLTADQILTGPNFGLESTRDTLTESLIHEIHQLRLAQKNRKLSPKEVDRLNQLSFKFDEIAPPVASHDQLEDWKREKAEIRQYSAKLRKRKP